MTTLLIADDENAFLDFMVRLLQKDHQLLVARSWNEVLEKFEANLWRLNATILDVNMPGLSVDPFTMIEKLLKSNPTVPMIIISGQDIVLRHEFLKMGVFQYHGKPLDMMDLKLTIKSALNYNRALRKLENYERVERDQTKYYQKLLGLDFYELREKIVSQDTSTKASILIRAEEGGRPGMIAEIISEEIDQKLFFRKVCHESLKNILPYNLQNGDTLFLEGLENLGKEEILYLTNVITELETGSNGTVGRQPNFRFIASISQLNENHIEQNQELKHLLDLIARVELRVEPLRLRKHELRGVISSVFEKKKKERFAKTVEISEDLMELLIEYNWPLNIEEVELVVESLLMTCQESLILPKHLHQLDFSDMENSKCPTLDDMVDEHIKKALRITMGNKSRAAKMLGITPKTLYARIRN